jgi:hypothetical protein
LSRKQAVIVAIDGPKEDMKTAVQTLDQFLRDNQDQSCQGGDGRKIIYPDASLHELVNILVELYTPTFSQYSLWRFRAFNDPDEKQVVLLSTIAKHTKTSEIIIERWSFDNLLLSIETYGDVLAQFKGNLILKSLSKTDPSHWRAMVSSRLSAIRKRDNFTIHDVSTTRDGGREANVTLA